MSVLTLSPSPPAELARDRALARFELATARAERRKCFGAPRMHTRRCLKCRDFDLCYHRHLQITQQGRIGLLTHRRSL